MRDLRELESHRVRESWVLRRFGTVGDDTCGVFLFLRSTAQLRVIAAAAAGWDHLSVSTATRCPTWAEMDYLKRRFFRDDEVAMQLHVTPAEHINDHPRVLHIWRPWDSPIPLPPRIMV